MTKRNLEVPLVRDRNYWMAADEPGGSSVICHQGLHRALRLAGATTIIAVFSVTDNGDHDYYDIVEAPWGCGRLKQIKQGLLWSATRRLGQAWTAGYRYLHFEIDETDT